MYTLDIGAAIVIATFALINFAIFAVNMCNALLHGHDGCEGLLAFRMPVWLMTAFVVLVSGLAIGLRPHFDYMIVTMVIAAIAAVVQSLLATVVTNSYDAQPHHY